MPTENMKNSVGPVLDALYLDMFHLIEAHTKCRVDMERTQAGGSILLARTKFQQGSSTLGIAQIPTENSAEAHALCRVVSDSENSDISIDRHAVDKSNGYPEPLNWFSAMPPMSLRTAASKFRDCTELVAESANLQRELDRIVNSINKLRRLLSIQ